ncbi:MAG: Ig-like domain repeat protein [Acidobacteriota bacterium]|nr:Ig-like domain repeat protein [Acidobacteriota bacterium]
MRLLRTLILPLFVIALVCGTPSLAQDSARAARIVDKVDESQLVPLKGDTHPEANSRNDLGPVSPNLPMTDLVLVLRRSPEQQAAFDEFVSSQYDSSSPNFHHWLEPAEVGKRFGPSLTDISTISGWLTGHGFSIAEVSKNRMSIRFNGTAAQVERAFHTEIHNLSVKGKQHIGNISDPQIPAALAPVVAGVKALHNFFPRPLHSLSSKAAFNSETGRWQRLANPQATGATVSLSPDVTTARPEFGISIGTGSSAYVIEDVAPYDFATIYNVLPLWSAGIDGTGETIAIAGTSDIDNADVATFRSVFGLPAGTTPKTIVANGIDPGLCTSTSSTSPCTIGDLIENTLDVEWSGAVAKGASIVLVVSGQTSPMTDTVYSSADYVIQNNIANILNVSYGECELFAGTSGNAAYNNLWETAATEGIAVFVASGDAGAATCDQGMASSVPYRAQYGLTVSGLASTPYNTAVGGTDLNWGTTASPYWGASNNSGNGSNALGYIPEVPWNDTCTNPLALSYLQKWAAALQKAGYAATSPTDAESACNFVITWYTTIYNNTSPAVNLAGFVNTVGGGGGASSCTTSDGATNSTCAGGYTKPSWQSGPVGIPADGKRDLPDVSFFASNGFLGSAYLMCVSATGTCVTSTSLTTEPVGQEVGGTSVASPAMAGVMALINQKAGMAQGNPNAELYSLGAKQTYTNCKAETGKTNNGCYFNDIDTGTIAMPCALNSPNCTVLYSGDSTGVLSGYGATTGFDPATGLGSLNVANVVNAWTSTIGTATATMTLTPSQSSLPLNQSLSVAVAVSGSNGTPTGTVALVGGGYTAAAGTLSGGSYTFTIPADSLSTGNDTLKASYSGDATYAATTGTASVTISKLTPTVTVQPNSTTVGANSNGVSVTITVAGAGPGPTGTVTASVPGYTSPSCALLTGNCTIVIPVGNLTNGTDTITANYSGDSNYNAASGTTTVTVNILTPTVQVTPSATSLSSISSLQVAVNVTGSGGTPTGNVNLSGLYAGSSMGAILVGGSYTFTVGPGGLNPGTDTLTVTYSGDNTYLAASAKTAVTVTQVTPTVTVTPAATSIASNVALTVTGSVTGAGPTPTGQVTLIAGGQSFGSFLSGGSYSVTIPAGSLSSGVDTLTATYSGDNIYTSATNSASVTVTAFTKLTPVVTVTPASGSVDSGQSLNVTATVTGTDGTPTGTVTLSSGGYTSFTQTLYNGSWTFTIPPNSLSAGTDSLSVNYSGDATYLAGTGASSATVTQSAYALAASTPAAVAPGGSTNSTITVSTSTGYTGTVTVTCALTSSPTGASYLPTCSTPGFVGLLSGATSGTLTASVATTAATAALARPGLGRWVDAGSSVVLAFLVFLGIPARRRSWRAMLGVLVLLMTFAGLSACGGGGAASVGGSGGNSGTTAGNYTFTVTGKGDPAVNPAPTATFTVAVN